MSDIDYILYPEWIVPVVPRDAVLTNHCVVISESRIVNICPNSEGRELEAKRHIELPQHVLLPGLINCHGHAAMSLLRGYADDVGIKIHVAEGGGATQQELCER